MVETVCRSLLKPLEIFYRISILLYPRAFREEFGRELFDTYRARSKELQGRSGARAALKFWWQSEIDLAAVRLEQASSSRQRSRLRRRPAVSRFSIFRGKPMFDLWRDAVQSLRFLIQKPLWTLSIILTLTLGIGINSVVFTGVNDILFYEPPARPAGRLYNLFAFNRKTGRYSHDFSYPNYADFARQAESLSGILIHQMHRGAVTIDRSTEIHYGEKVSANYFDVLGREASIGRVFRAEDASQTDLVVVLSHALWRDRFASNPAVVGGTILMDGQGFAVLGVMPADFDGTEYGLSMDFWVPLSEGLKGIYGYIRSEMEGRGSSNFDPPVARLRSGVSASEAEAELKVISQRLEERYPDDLEDWEVHLASAIGPPLPPNVSQIGRFSGALLMGLVALVLLLACANVAGLLLARAESRRREIGIRIALGAGRFRIVRQLLTESLFLSLGGGVVAALVAYFLAPKLWLSLLPHFQYRWGLDFTPDAGVLAYTALVTAVTAFAFGLAPALQAIRADVVGSLKDGQGFLLRAGKPNRLRVGLVAGQLAVSFVLLTFAALFALSLSNSRRIETGFDRDNILLMGIELGNRNLDRETGRAIYRKIRENLAGLPGVAPVSWTDNMPLDDEGNEVDVWVPGVHQEKRDAVGPEFYAVGTDFFQVLGISLVNGRTFNRDDLPGGTRAVIVNESFARLTWPGQTPLGKTITFQGVEKPLEVVGVAPDLKHFDLLESTRAAVFVPLAQTYRSSLTLVLRTEGNPSLMTPIVRRTVAELDPQIPVFNIKTISQHLTRSLWLPEMGANLAVIFGILAMALTAVGLNGVASYSVSRRKREIGIRMAVGANRRDVIRLIGRQTVGLVAAGSIIGLGVAAVSTTFLERILVGISGVPWLILSLVVLLLAAVTLVAIYAPIRRATKVDPTRALRFE